jgi:hypothetical protein
MSKPEGFWDDDQDILDCVNVIQGPLNELGAKLNLDAVLVVLLNLLVEAARRNGKPKLELQRLLVNVWDGLEWHERHGR